MAQIVLSELIDDVRSRLDETVVRYWTDTELTRWISEGLRDIARRTLCLWDVKSYNTTASKQKYDLPDDMLQIYRVEYRQVPGQTSYALEFQTMNSMDDVWYQSREIPGGQPVYYSVWGTPGVGVQQLYLYPAPSTSLADGLRVYYYRLPRKMNVTVDATGKYVAGSGATDPADIPAGWQDAVPLYVEVVARRKEAKDKRWQEAQQLYEMTLENMMKVTRQWSDQETFVSGQSLPGGAPDWLVSDWSW